MSPPGSKRYRPKCTANARRPAPTASSTPACVDISAGEESRESIFTPLREAIQPQRQHLARLGVDAWHAEGYRGQGVKIAILDTGFHNYHRYLGTALPDHVTVHSFRRDGNLEAKDSI